MKLEHFLTPYTKINSKWSKDLNLRPETIQLLEENIGKTLSDINHSRILYDPPPRILEIKAKINKWDLIKLRNPGIELRSPAFIACRLLDRSHSDWREMVPHCGFDLHFSDNK